MNEKEITRKIGQRIQKLRRDKGYTQMVFSEMVGISNNYLSDIERGVSTPRMDKLIAIMDALECSADDIFCDVIRRGHRVKSSQLAERIEALPAVEQDKVLAIIDVLIEYSK